MNNIFTKYKNANKGTTLIEMIISFALLGIFMVAVGTIISLVANMYYHVKGETYSKQVSDIVLEKVASEIEGAKYEVVVEGETSSINPFISSGNTKITLYDRTDTKIDMSASGGVLKVHYYEINDSVHPERSRNETTWMFDKNVYNGYSIESLEFIEGSKLSSYSDIDDFNLSDSDKNYGDDIIFIFLKIKNSKYGEYNVYRTVKMYNVSGS